MTDTDLTVHNATSFSDINTFARCPKSYDYRVNQKLQARRRSVPLTMGSLVHEQIQGFYLGHLGDVRIEQENRLQGEVVEFDDALMSLAVLVEDATSLVNRYIQHYSTDTWQPLHVEEQFFVQLAGNGRVLSFTPDLVVSDPNGDVWVVDHKTTSKRYPRAPQPMDNMTHQPLLYLAGVQSVYPECRGFVFDFLRKKTPTAPRLTKQGTVADINRIDTTAEMLVQFMMDEAPHLLDDPVHLNRAAELRITNPYFWRQTVYATPQLLAQGMADVMDWVTAMNYATAGDLYPRSFQGCDRCEFAPLCHAELLVLPGVDDIKTTQYQPREPKNVYEAEGDE